jgi:hypothetical protein
MSHPTSISMQTNKLTILIEKSGRKTNFSNPLITMLISLAEKGDLYKESAEFTKVIKMCSKINYLLYHLRNNKRAD